ncbi:MAG TPA: ATP-binding protein [Acidobacteriota bacterium]|nr:ATP-binding protein [Acidobacteriota bacterium]HQM63063.1 ATP-binding protein [Acidobacteriota bacterium]
MGKVTLPDWAQGMREIFRAETVSQFILHGNVNDLVPHREDDALRFLTLGDYLSEVLFQPFDVVLFYDRGRGIRLARGADHFHAFLQVMDKYHGSRYASDAAAGRNPDRALDSPGLLPRAPAQALELIDRFLNGVVAASRNPKAAGPRKVAVVIQFAHFIVPRGESLYLSGEIGANLIKIRNWAEDPAILGANVATVLVSENLLDLSAYLTDSPASGKIQVPMPGAEEIRDYVVKLVAGEPDFAALCEVDVPTLAAKLVGLNRVQVRNLVLRAVRNRETLTLKYLTRLKKETIEKESMGRLEFVESRRTLDDVAGHHEAKRWLREDAQLIRRNVANALPMGYLITGRIGTGKTWLVECFAGECGIPMVELKNFREKWVGATEGNLEKIFTILHALGQVMVFVDEADQATGRRGGGEGDSGLSGRVYGMLAKEMADTANRGRIFWIFATSRPDMVEVDLKRQGRLDVHIPLFPPVDTSDKRELFLAMARKLRLDLRPEDLPELASDQPVSGNELEGLLVRTVRRHALQSSPVVPPASSPGVPPGSSSGVPPEGKPIAPPPAGSMKSLAEILRDEVAGFRPSAHTARLEMMDLLAVKECTDDRFLPPRFRELSPEEIDRRLAALTFGGR